MGNADGELEYETLQDAASIARYLKAITDGFSNGSLVFSSKDGEVELIPEGLIELTVKASRKRNKMQVSVRASWKTSEGDERGRNDALSITSNGK